MPSLLSVRPDTEQQLRRACAEIEHRLRHGEPCRAEEFFAACPGFADQQEPALDLLYTEYLTRADLARQALTDELAARFPRWRQALLAQIQFERWLSHNLPEESFSNDVTPTDARAPAGVGREGPSGFEELEELARGG